MQQPIYADTQTTIHPVVKAARRLATALGHTSEFEQYEEAFRKFRTDKEAQRLLNEFQQAQQDYQMKQSWGGVNETEQKNLQKKKEAVLAHPVLKNYFQAQENLVVLLKEVNAFISEQIGIEFAGTAKPAGGCC